MGTVGKTHTRLGKLSQRDRMFGSETTFLAMKSLLDSVGNYSAQWLALMSERPVSEVCATDYAVYIKF